MKEIRIYKSENGKEPFTLWLKKLKDKMIRARIMRRIDRLYLGNEGDHKSIGDGVFKLRMAFGSGYRVYYAKNNEITYILLFGGDKRTQENDIRLAKQYWAILKLGEENE
jgi:putative addiction module killer protein